MAWIVGQAGILQTCLLYSTCFFTVFLSSLSIGALISDQNQPALSGGVYPLISRAVGKIWGGAVSYALYTAYLLGNAFFSLGVGEGVYEGFFRDSLFTREKVTFVCALISLLLSFLISVSNNKYFTLTNLVICVWALGLIVVGLMHIVWMELLDEVSSTSTLPQQHLVSHFTENWPPLFTLSSRCGQEVCSNTKLLLIIFPASAGMLQGLNLSGEILDPKGSIPMGTLQATLFSFLVYISLVLVYGMVCC